MGILEHINSPADLRGLTPQELTALCEEIRGFLVKKVSQTGGHLASSLGVVELTVALHRVFDTSKDRLVFDVGHQSYVHKLLTGRRGRFDTLRQLGGLSGFPKPRESVHDAFIAGHASNSVSVALGMARAAKLTGADYSCIALIGDGAMTGGLAYEGLCCAGDSGLPLIVILNDNGMAIESNVGAIAKYLQKERTKPGYFSFKKNYRKFMARFPGGKTLYRINHRLKSAVKMAFLHCSMFEEMGFEYIGPVDGHDIKQLETTLSWAKELKKPVIVHTITKKGKGYCFSEENPDAYHGVSSFDPQVCIDMMAGKSFSTVAGRTLAALAGKDSRICAITAAMMGGTGLTEFAGRYPDRFFDVGITEGNAVSMAAGMAKQGLIPVVAIYSTFLQRAYDMLLHDVAISGLHVVFAVDRAGLVGEDGETHQGIFDVAYLTSVPGMTVLCPASYCELEAMLAQAVQEIRGPVAVRYPRGAEEEYSDCITDASRVLRKGTDVTLAAYGITVNTALKTAELLAQKGISAEVIKLGQIAPLPAGDILRSVEKTGFLTVIEECTAAGSVGRQLSAVLAEAGVPVKKLLLLDLGRQFVDAGKISQLRQLCGIDAESAANAIWEEWKNE